MPQRESSICVVGSLNADLVVRLERAPRAGETVLGTALERFPGGKGANQAVAAARLASGGGASLGTSGATIAVKVSMIGCVGDDAEGVWLRAGLAAAGVDVAGVAVDPGAPTGLAVITVDAAGENRIVVVPGANASLTPAALEPHQGEIGAADLVLLQLEVPMATVVAAARGARAHGALVVLDPAPAAAVPDELLALCDYVTPNESELRTLVGGGAASDAELTPEGAAGLARRLLDRGARRVVVKLGARGALLVTAEDERLWPAPAVEAVDTTAAGDAWNGAFAVALAEGRELDDAGRFACAAAALSVTRPGAQSSLPARAELPERGGVWASPPRTENSPAGGAGRP